MNNKIKTWMAELRLPFLTATVVSILLGTVIAWVRNDIFDQYVFVLTLVGAMSFHLGTNVANDYFDHVSGNDEINKDFVRPFTGGSRMIQLNKLTPREVLRGAIVLFSFGALIGIYLALTRGYFIFAFAAIGLISGVFYTSPLFNWGSRGFGEALVGVNFGTLLTLGAFYVQTQTLSWEPIIASIPVSLLIVSVLYVNEFPDYIADKSTKKKTIVVRLGRSKAAYGYMIIVVSAYLILFLNVLLGITPPHTLFALLPFILGLTAMRLVSKYNLIPQKLAPANALTISFHFLSSFLVSLGYLSFGLAIMSVPFYIVIAIVGFCMILTISLYLKSNRG